MVVIIQICKREIEKRVLVRPRVKFPQAVLIVKEEKTPRPVSQQTLWGYWPNREKEGNFFGNAAKEVDIFINHKQPTPGEKKKVKKPSSKKRNQAQEGERPTALQKP